MGKTIKLASVLLKCGLGTGTTDKKNKLFTNIFGSPITLICLLPIMYYIFKAGIFIRTVFGSLDDNGLILGFILFIVSSVIFCTGIASCINSFYLSSNLNTLLVMPFTSAQITGAKFMVAAIYEYYISLAVLAPFLIGYGYAGGFSAAYWLGALLAVLFLPIAPLAYAGILSMIIMRFIGGAKNKERMTALGAVGLFMFSIVYEVFRNVIQGMKTDDIENIFAQLTQTLHRISSIFPDIPFLVNIMEKQDLLSCLWSVVSVILIIAVFLFAAKHLYLAGAVGMQSTSASHKKLSETQLKKSNRRSSVVWSYTRKELKTLFRTPAYYMSCLLLTLGWPLVLIPSLLFSKAEQNELSSIENLLLSADSGAYFLFVLFCIVFGITIFAATLNGIAPSAISREGQCFPIMKQLPISYKMQLKAKRNAALIICFAGSGGYMLIGELILILSKKFPWWAIFPTLLFNLLLLYIIIDLEMIYGLHKPKLIWESEGDVANGNRIGFLLFLIGIVVCFVLVFTLNGWVKSLAADSWIFFGALTGILAVIAFLTDRIFYLYGRKRLENL